MRWLSLHALQRECTQFEMQPLLTRTLHEHLVDHFAVSTAKCSQRPLWQYVSLRKYLERFGLGLSTPAWVIGRPAMALRLRDGLC